MPINNKYMKSLSHLSSLLNQSLANKDKGYNNIIENESIPISNNYMSLNLCSCKLTVRVESA